MKNPFRKLTLAEAEQADFLEAQLGYHEARKAQEYAAAMAEMYLGRMKRLGHEGLAGFDFPPVPKS